MNASRRWVATFSYAVLVIEVKCIVEWACWSEELTEVVSRLVTAVSYRLYYCSFEAIAERIVDA